LTSTMFHPSDNSIAYSTSLSTHLHTHDLLTPSSQPISSTPFSAPLISLTSLPSISLLALGTTTNKILLHDPRAQSITITTLSGHEGFVSSLSPSPENQHMFASGAFDGYVRVWDVRNPTGSVFKLDREANSGKILSIDWNERGLVSGGQDGKLDIWQGNNNSMAKL
jgi:ribosome biogenesis protein